MFAAEATSTRDWERISDEPLRVETELQPLGMDGIRQRPSYPETQCQGALRPESLVSPAGSRRSPRRCSQRPRPGRQVGQNERRFHLFEPSPRLNQLALLNMFECVGCCFNPSQELQDQWTDLPCRSTIATRIIKARVDTPMSKLSSSLSGATVLACSLLLSCTVFASTPTAAAKVRHVFIIVLENKNFEDTFGTSGQDPFLRNTLVPRGALLKQYYGTGHFSLDNYISLISGQAPTADTANDCTTLTATGSSANFDDIVLAGTTSDGQVISRHGCVYPRTVKTLPDQLVAAGLRWKAYMEDMGNDRTRESATCAHPAIGQGTDNTNGAEAPNSTVPQGDAYATRHDPFMYFHSIIDSKECQTRVVNLRGLSTDLARVTTTPNLVFISPNLCHDGHDGSGTSAPGTTCANGEPGGLTSADAFLRTWVPRIMDSPAYKADGLLIITFDEGNYTVIESKEPSTGRSSITVTFPGTTCCGQQPGPNLMGFRPGTTILMDTPSKIQRLVVNGFGGDRIGALLLSPFVKSGSSSDIPYNHYSLLRTLENIFGLSQHLGYAADNPQLNYHLSTIENDPAVFVAIPGSPFR